MGWAFGTRRTARTVHIGRKSGAMLNQEKQSMIELKLSDWLVNEMDVWNV